MKNLVTPVSDNIRRTPGNPVVQRTKDKAESQALAIAARKAELSGLPVVWAKKQ